MNEELQLAIKSIEEDGKIRKQPLQVIRDNRDEATSFFLSILYNKGGKDK